MQALHFVSLAVTDPQSRFPHWDAAPQKLLGLLRLSLRTAGPRARFNDYFWCQENLFVWKAELGWEGLFPIGDHFLCLETVANRGERRPEAFSDLPPSGGGFGSGVRIGNWKTRFCLLLALNFTPLQNS